METVKNYYEHAKRPQEVKMKELPLTNDGNT